MGMSAKRILAPNAMENEKIEATVWTPLSTPFSCVIDGIQQPRSAQSEIQDSKLKIHQKK